MRKIIALAVALAAVFFAAPARAQVAPSATGRIIVHSGQNPSSTETNQQARFDRLIIGTALRDLFGSAIGTGTYANLTVTPNGGMTVAVAPIAAAGLGSIYQTGPDDTNAVPADETTQIPADTTPIIILATQSATSGSIGPISAPASGLSQYYLLEAQVDTEDGATQSELFVNANGDQSYSSVPSVRYDAIAYQLVPGTASGSPTVPAATTGWFGIAKILVPSGTSTITTGMITMLPAFAGVVTNGTTVTLNGLVLAGATAGCLETNSSGVVSSQSCTGGLGTVNATYPLSSSTTSGVATVTCATCITSVTATSPLGTTTSGTSVAVAIATPIPVALGGTGSASPTGVTATAPLSVTGSFPNKIVALTGVVPLANGGTGSSTQNFVDLSSAQNIYGAKTFESPPMFPGFTSTAAITAPGVTSTAGVAVGGALTGATTGSFSGAISGAGYSGGPIAGTTGTFTGALTAPSATITGPLTISSASNGIMMPSTPNAYVLSTGVATLHMGRSDLSAATVSGATMDFYSSAGTLMALDGSGDIGAAGSLYAAGGQLFLSSSGVAGPAYIGNDSAGGGLNISIEGAYGVRFWNDLATASSPIAQLDPSGNFYATTFNVSSRRELKDSFAPIADPLSVINSKALAVSTWCYKRERCKPGQHLHIGPMANDAPVYLSGPKHDHIDQTALNGLTLAAVQQLAAIVEQLRKENAFLRDRINAVIRENARAVPQWENLHFDPAVKF